MSRQFRYRVTAIALSGLIFGLPMLVNGTASAEQTHVGGRQVVFEGGGIMTLSCRSRPDVESMVVPADTTVRVVNRTGYSARLELGGDTKGTLPDDASTEVVFRRGTTAVTLRPNCPLTDDATPVLVTASPSASAAMPDPIPAPSDGTPSAVSAAPSGSEGPDAATSGSAMPDSVAPPAGPTRVIRSATRRPAVMRTSAVAQAATAAARITPDGAKTTKIKSAARTRAGATPPFAGMPPGEKKELVTGVPRLDTVPLPSAPLPVEPAPPAPVAAAEPVATMEQMSEGGPIGLLGLIAAVCVLGVGTAAIRAIVSQRANRARIA